MRAKAEGKKIDNDRERDREREKRARSREITKNDVEKPAESLTTSRDRPTGAGISAKEDGREIRDEDTPGHRRVARGKCI